MMNRYRYALIASLTMLLLVVPFSCFGMNTADMPDLRLTASATSEVVDFHTLTADLSQADVVYLGETHDHPADHQAQFTLVQALYEQAQRQNQSAKTLPNPPMVIALEMFQQSFQTVLDRYMAGEITEAHLIEQSEYDTRWGFPWQYYAPIVRFAKAHQLPLVALTLPSEVNAQIISHGIDSLTPEPWLPSLSEIDLDQSEYRQILLNFYQATHQGHGSADGFDTFFLIQSLWDETMAARVSRALQTYAHSQVVVLAGQGHVMYGFGIPQRVERRQPRALLRQRSVILSPNVEAFGSDIASPMADYLGNPLGSPATD
jgi:uncharacterized iron-regulated protein